MRLEVLIDQQEPLIFPLNKEKITIGSGDNSDILLDAEGVSRRHVVIHCSEDEFYVVDQGSTNGTFINEERLVPGKRVEFTSFFPVRLGANVLLTLLSDEEASEFALSSFNTPSTSLSDQTDDTTKVINTSLLKESSSGLNAYSRKASVRSRNSSRGKSAAEKTGKGKNKRPVKKPERNLNVVVIGSVIIVLVAIYFHLNGKEEVIVMNPPEVTTIGTVEEKAPEVALVSKEFFKSVEEVSRIQMDFKCTSRIEKEICDSLELSAPYGATQVGLDVFVFEKVAIDKKYLFRLNQIYPEISNGHYPMEVFLAYYFTQKNLELSDEFDDYRIHLYFLNEEEEVFGGVSFYSKAYDAFATAAAGNLFTNFLRSGKLALTFTENYFVFHEDFPAAPPSVDEDVVEDEEGKQQPVESELESF